MKTPLSPTHLRPETAKWWAQIVEEYQLESHHLRLLQSCCEAWDRMAEARERIAADGAYTEDRFKQLKTHPAVAVERDSRISFSRCLRELGLDIETSADESRPPIIRGSANLKAIG